MPSLDWWEEQRQGDALEKVVVTIGGERLRGTDVEEQWRGGLLLAAHERLLSQADWERIIYARNDMQIEFAPGALSTSGSSFWGAQDEEQKALREADEALRKVFIRARDAQLEYRRADLDALMGSYAHRHEIEYAKGLRIVMETHAADLLRAIHKAAGWGSSLGQLLENDFPELFDAQVLKNLVEYEQRERLEGMPDYEG